MRRWVVRIVLGLLLTGLAVAAVPAVRIAPLVEDDLALDRIVVAVVLDWRDFGEDKARERLQYELDLQHIGAQVDEGDCALAEDADGVKQVACAWEVQVSLPFSADPYTLSFASAARVDAHGVLLR
ncbi:MAG: hypothetical protein H6733_07975 [Alphaproteobacteria bacterium]|nr:hypothetical protein [Alphaproteobacteria bacterium]